MRRFSGLPKYCRNRTMKHVKSVIFFLFSYCLIGCCTHAKHRRGCTQGILAAQGGMGTEKARDHWVRGKGNKKKPRSETEGRERKKGFKRLGWLGNALDGWCGGHGKVSKGDHKKKLTGSGSRGQVSFGGVLVDHRPMINF